MSPLKGKHIVVGICGGIAAYKTASLVRLFVKAGAEVQVIMTPSAKEFITPLTLATLSNNPVISEFFTANTGEWHSHVSLGLWADAMVIAPCTASTLGKMANGVADNMLVTTYLSAKEKVFIAPSMDLDMFAHPTTKRNLKILEEDGVGIIEPAVGELASHLIGKGRMAEPEEIISHIEAYFSKNNSLEGKKIVVTAGPTYENIDPVRFIGNYSSGKMGFCIANELAERGAEVVLISGPVALTTPHTKIRRIDVVSAKEMCKAAVEEFKDADSAILSAAVADYAPARCEDHKIKRENRDEMILQLVKNPDIAATLGELKKENQSLIGFALETDNELENALKKMKRKNLDWIVVNSLKDKEAGFQKDTNKVSIISKEGNMKKYPAKSKKEVAKDIIDLIYN